MNDEEELDEEQEIKYVLGEYEAICPH